MGCEGWSDVDSGMKVVSYQVYPLAPDTEGQLVETLTPIAQARHVSSWYVTRTRTLGSLVRRVIDWMQDWGRVFLLWFSRA